MTIPDYDTDFYARTQAQVDALRAKNWAALDLEHVIEEIPDLGNEQRHAVEDHLRILDAQTIAGSLLRRHLPPDRIAGAETAKALGRGAWRPLAGPNGPAGSLLCIDVFGIMVYDWLAWQGAKTALNPWGASATTRWSQSLHFVYPCAKPTSRCKGEERP